MKRREVLSKIGPGLLLLGPAILTACGGGGSSSTPPRVAVFGDSLFSGRGLAIPPVVRMREALPGVTIDDCSVPSMRAFEAGELMRTKLAETRPTVAAIFFGGADVIGLTPPADFEAAMRVRIAEAQAAGARVLLKTILRHPAYLPGVQALNAVIWRLAQELGTSLADTYSLPTGGFLPDGVHPDQTYSDACTAVETDAVRLALASTPAPAHAPDA